MLLDTLTAAPAELISPMLQRGFAVLTPIQRAVLEGDVAGRDLRISSQTGSGKTVAIGLVLARELLSRGAPALPREPRRGPAALLITPTRELAVQVREELRWLYAELPDTRVEVVTGGTSIELERRMLARFPRVLVGTPGRLLDHLRGGALDCSAVHSVVLDEADQMFDLGFRDDLDAIVAALPDTRRSHLVSATFPRAVLRLADCFQRNPMQLQGTPLGAAHEDIEHIAYLIPDRAMHGALVNLLLTMQGELTLVFVRRRSDASELAERLAADGFAAFPFSGELSQSQRNRTLDAFRKRSIDILVSTDVAARGIDVADISAVIHVEPPQDTAIYTHRSGRTGRAGRKGRSLLLVPRSAERRVERILEAANVSRSWRTLPCAQAIRELQRERAQQALEQRLREAQAPDDAQLAQAERILAGPDARLQVAALLRLAAPRAPREPIELGPIEAPTRAAPSRPRSAHTGRFVRFSINYGRRAGATPDRVLAHVCRRANLQKQCVGAIRIEATSSTFEIAEHSADVFEASTRAPDSREPKLRIRREPDAPKRARPGRAAPPGAERTARPNFHRASGKTGSSKASRKTKATARVEGH